MTVGFDVKLIIRQLISRYSINDKDHVLIIIPKPQDQQSLEKQNATLNDLRKILDYVSARYGTVEVDPADTVNAITSIGKAIRKSVSNGMEGIYLILSGGMRALVIETLLASLLTLGEELTLRSWLSIELENLSGYVEIPLSLFTGLRLDTTDLEILSTIPRLGNPGQLIRELDLPKSTAYRKIRKLRETALIERKGNNYSITKWGQLILNLNKDTHERSG